MDTFYDSIKKEVNDKSLDIKNSFTQNIKDLEVDIQRLLDKKANLYDVTSMINNKADITVLQTKVYFLFRSKLGFRLG